MAVLTSVSGFPRIGAQRELKRVIERYWKGEENLDSVRSVAQTLRKTHWLSQQQAGIDLIPSNDFSLYDQVLDTALLLNVLPQRYRRLGLAEAEDTLFAVARGYQGNQGDVTALPMKKWFTTNYHYIVPELDESSEIRLVGTKPFDEFEEAKALGITTKPVLIGPYTFLNLLRNAQGTPVTAEYGIINALADAYRQIVSRFVELNAEWIQFDEPWLAHDTSAQDLSVLKALYSKILPAKAQLKVLVNTYFGDIRDSYETLTLLDIDGIGLDFVEGREQNLNAIRKYGVPEQVTLFAGVVSGRNIWRNHYQQSLAIIDELQQHTNRIVVQTACSLLHVPYTTANETKLNTTVLEHLAFANEKLSELAELQSLAQLNPEEREQQKSYQRNLALHNGSRVAADQTVGERVNNLKESDYTRLPERSERLATQQADLQLPILPTTTIGSFPQTRYVRELRAQYRKGEIDQQTYESRIDALIDDVIERQEVVGLDVLVHGEFERNDMVEYFGTKLNGFLFTANAWVQSYGTRCVKPPLIWSDVSRPEPMTVRWISYAQSRTHKPVKGMLTGPVTILNWSWPREDISQSLQATQIALAIRDEVLDLERAGIRIIQVDEAALREKLPLRRQDWHTGYLDWALRAFRLVHSGVGEHTQIHTHMCYSEFNEIIRDIDAMDADVISFEASRGDLLVLDALQQSGFQTQVGPGVYDIHSPRVPSQEEIEQRIRLILQHVPARNVWINPDCGLKTRGEQETWAALDNLVQATRVVRSSL